MNNNTTPLLVVKGFLCAKNLELIHNIYPHVSKDHLYSYMQQYIKTHQSRLRTDMEPKRQLKLINDKFLEIIKQFMEQPTVSTNPHKSKQIFSPPATLQQRAPLNHSMLSAVNHVPQPTMNHAVPVMHQSIAQPGLGFLGNHTQPPSTGFEEDDEDEYETILSDDEEWCTRLDESYAILMRQHLSKQSRQARPVTVQVAYNERTQDRLEAVHQETVHQELVHNRDVPQNSVQEPMQESVQETVQETAQEIVKKAVPEKVKNSVPSDRNKEPERQEEHDIDDLPLLSL